MIVTVPMCDLCKRPVAWHGRRARHRRPCGPLSGAAVGPMTTDERARYAAASPR